MACSRCICAAYRVVQDTNDDVSTDCYECGHSSDCHDSSHHQSKRKKVENIDATVRTTESVSESELLRKESQEDTETQSATQESLRGGLRIHKPRAWRLGIDNPSLLHDILREDGVVVVPGIITPTEADSFSVGIREALHTCNPHWADSPETAPSPGTRGHGLQKLYGVALSEASQKLRCHVNAQSVFGALYQTQDLVGSVDAPGLVTIHTLRARKGKATKGVFAGSSLPPHVDMTEAGPSAELVSKHISLPKL